MNEDEILGTAIAVCIIGCGIANLFCIWFNVGNRRDEDMYVALRDIV